VLLAAELLAAVGKRTMRLRFRRSIRSPAMCSLGGKRGQGLFTSKSEQIECEKAGEEEEEGGGDKQVSKKNF